MTELEWILLFRDMRRSWGDRLHFRECKGDGVFSEYHLRMIGLPVRESL